jgi:hypothetical protein
VNKQIVEEEEKRRTWLSSPVRYPNFKLHSIHASRSSAAAACRRRSQLSMNSLLYVRVAPKSTSSTCGRRGVVKRHGKRKEVEESGEEMAKRKGERGREERKKTTHLPRLTIPQKIRPIRISLHRSKLKQFL